MIMMKNLIVVASVVEVVVDRWLRGVDSGCGVTVITWLGVVVDLGVADGG